jgi:hypothetical protein
MVAWSMVTRPLELGGLGSFHYVRICSQNAMGVVSTGRAGADVAS